MKDARAGGDQAGDRGPPRPQGGRRLHGHRRRPLAAAGLVQTALAAAGLEVVCSYVSLTELSEYAPGLPEEMKQARLYPTLPPDGKPAFCFYPMSKRRTATVQLVRA